MRLESIFDALVAAFNNMPTSSGRVLHSSTQKGEELPRVTWEIGQWQTQDWTPESFRLQWTLPVEIVIDGELGDQKPMLSLIQDLYDWSARVQGLPVTADGVVVPAARVLPDNTIVDDWDGLDRLMQAGTVQPIAQRFMGPSFQKIQVPPTNSNVTTAKGQVYIECEVPTKTYDLVYPRVFVLGIQPMTMLKERIAFDPNDPEENWLPQPTGDDVSASTPDTLPAPFIGIVGQERLVIRAPIDTADLPSLEGYDPSTLLRRIDVIPGAVVVTTTQQMLAQGVFDDGGTANYTANATWQSSTPGVATVNSSGLVTAVAPGTTTITATFSGIYGSAIITVL